jgi:hypothetical protein
MTIRREDPAGLAALLLGQPDLSERLMRALGLKGTLPQFLDRKFSPGVTVEDLTKPEYSWLRRETLWEAGQAVPAVAADFGVGTVGPKSGMAGRTTIFVVEQVTLSNTAATATSLRFGLISTANIGSAAPTGSGAPRDDRYAGAAVNQSVAGVGSGSNNASPTTFTSTSFVLLAAGQTLGPFPGPWVLTNGVGPTAASQVLFGVWGTEINKAFSFHVVWRERLMLSSETL